MKTEWKSAKRKKKMKREETKSEINLLTNFTEMDDDDDDTEERSTDDMISF